MRRVSLYISMLAIVLGGLVVAGWRPAATAQEGTPGAMVRHPVVGAWVLETTSPTSPRSPAIFSADGTYFQAEADGTDSVGVWEATGERTATLTTLSVAAPGGGAPAVMIRATVEVAEDGQSLTADATLEFVAPDGTGSGQLGPTTATGQRIPLEAPGPPVGPLGPPPGSPAATPGA